MVRTQEDLKKMTIVVKLQWPLLHYISRVESLTEMDPKMTNTEIQHIMKVSLGSVICNLHNCFGVRKQCALWLLHKLSEEKKQGRMDWHMNMLWKFDRGRSPPIWDMVTGDVGIPIQTQDKATVSSMGLSSENPPVKFQSNRSASKQMILCFFTKSGHVSTILTVF